MWWNQCDSFREGVMVGAGIGSLSATVALVALGLYISHRKHW